APRRDAASRDAKDKGVTEHQAVRVAVRDARLRGAARARVKVAAETVIRRLTAIPKQEAASREPPKRDTASVAIPSRAIASLAMAPLDLNTDVHGRAPGLPP